MAKPYFHEIEKVDTIVELDYESRVLGYYSLGHIDKDLFAEKVNKEYGDIPEYWTDIKAEDVKHRYFTVDPDWGIQYGSGKPITVWEVE